MEEEGLAIKVILDGWWRQKCKRKYNVLIILLLSGETLMRITLEEKQDTRNNQLFEFNSRLWIQLY